MKRFFLVMVFFFFTALTSLYAQVKIDAEGNVGMGAEPMSSGTTPTNKVKLYLTEGDISPSIRTAILKVEYTGYAGVHHYGVYSSVIPNQGWGYGGVFKGGYRGILAAAENTTYTGGSKSGVYTTANGGSINYGIYAAANEATSSATNYGVYGSAEGAGTNYAGYFQGNVAYTGTLTHISDAKYKKNIQDMGSTLGKVQKIKSRTFEYRDDEIKNFPRGKQYGFVAQELEEVFPELVTTEYMPPLNAGESEEEDMNASPTPYKSVNYIDMIPILVEAIQEQQAQIENQSKQISEQQAEIEQLRLLLINN